MINLLPPNGQKIAKREYVLRVGSTMCVLFGFLILLLAVAHVPTYVLIEAQTHELEDTQEKNATRKEALLKADDEVRKATSVLGQMKATKERASITLLLAEIQTHTSSDISYKTFVMKTDKAKKTISSIQIQGVATTRSALAQLKNALQSSKLFSKIEVPLADLVSETNAPFTLTVTLKEPI